MKSFVRGKHMDLMFVHKNLWRLGTLAAPSSEHPQFPASDSQIDTLKQSWRTRYGTGCGNGYFLVDATNNKIDFDESGAELTGTIASGAYNDNTLSTAVAAAMNAVGGQTYIVAYSESLGKFAIGATANFTLRWNTGTHKATDCSALLGFTTRPTIPGRRPTPGGPAAGSLHRALRTKRPRRGRGVRLHGDHRSQS